MIAVAQISLAYTVPVDVLIDTETREVQKVIVVVEALRQDRASNAVDIDDDTTPTAVQTDAAYAIAEADTEWPSWKLGW